MNLTEVIEILVEERGLERDAVVDVVCDGVLAAYRKKYPDLGFQVKYNNRSGEIEVFSEKEVVSSVEDPDFDITLRKARTFEPSAEVGQLIYFPFAEQVGRVEMLVAKQYIATHIRELEQRVVHDEFKEKEGTIVNGIIHKRERSGTVVKIGDSMAFLPRSCMVPDEPIRVGYPIRALLKEVLEQSRGEHQLILDRASELFIQRLIELEIPEVFEGTVQIRNIARTAGYKTKIVVSSNSSDIDPVGTCVGVGGVRIKPILKELGREKIDLIEYSEDLEHFIATALKPAEIDKVTLNEEEKVATVWLERDQRSYAIGKQGQNISLVSRLTGYHIQLQDDSGADDQAAEMLENHKAELDALKREVKEESFRDAPSGVVESENQED